MSTQMRRETYLSWNKHMEAVVPQGATRTHVIFKKQDLPAWENARVRIVTDADRKTYNLCQSDIVPSYIHEVFAKGDLLVYLEVPRRPRSSLSRVGGFLVAQTRPERNDIKILLICSNAPMPGVGKYLMAKAILVGRQRAKYVRLNALPKPRPFYAKKFGFVDNSKEEYNRHFRHHRPTYLGMLQEDRKMLGTKQDRERAITEREIRDAILESEGYPMILGRPSAPNRRLAVRTPTRSEARARRRSPRLQSVSDGRVVKRRSPRLIAR